MKSIKVLLGMAGAIILVVIAQLYFFSAERHYVKATISIGNSITMNIVDGPYQTDESCKTALSPLNNSMAHSCPQCARQSACGTQIDSNQRDALALKPIASPYVAIGSQRQIIEGAIDVTLPVCRAIAERVKTQSVAARCVEGPTAH